MLHKILNNHLYKGTLWVIGSNGLLALFGFLFWSIATNLFSATDVGKGVTLITILDIVLALSLFGLNTAIAHFVPKSNHKKRLTSTVFYTTSLVALCLGFIAALIVPFIIETTTTSLFHRVLFFTLGSVAYVWFRMIEPLFIVYRKGHFLFVKDSIFSIAKIVLLYFFAFFGSYGIFHAWWISAFLAAIMCIWLVPFHLKSFSFKDLKTMSKFSLSNYLAGIFGMAPNLLLPIIITSRLGAETTALYYVAMMIGALLYVIPDAITEPFISEAAHSPKKIKHITKQAVQFIFPLLFVGIIFLFVSGKFLLSIFGGTYKQAYLAMIFIAISSIAGAIITIYIQIKNAQHNLLPVILVNGFQALVVLVSIMLFMSKGISGIGFGWMIGEYIVALGVIMVWMHNG